MSNGIAVKLALGFILAVLLSCNCACYRQSRDENGEALKTRLQQLEDREEIRRLTLDYGRFLDQRDWDSFSQLFAQKDGEWIGGLGSAKGSEAIRKLMEKTIGTDRRTASLPNYHIFTNQMINLDGDRATTTTKWMFVVQGAEKQPQIVFLGHYDDILIRENGRWKFLRRVVYSDIPPDQP